jgi:hypothetical protein
MTNYEILGACAVMLIAVIAFLMGFDIENYEGDDDEGP